MDDDPTTDASEATDSALLRRGTRLEPALTGSRVGVEEARGDGPATDD